MFVYVVVRYYLLLIYLFFKLVCVDFDCFWFFVEKWVEICNEYGLNGKKVGIYVGKFGGIYLEDEFF